LLDTLCHVPAFQNNGLPPAAQIHRLINTVSTVVLSFDISLVTDIFGLNKNSLQNISIAAEDLLPAVLTSSPYKNKLQED
jgi:hypothetical protein